MGLWAKLTHVNIISLPHPKRYFFFPRPPHPCDMLNQAHQEKPESRALNLSRTPLLPPSPSSLGSTSVGRDLPKPKTSSMGEQQPRRTRRRRLCLLALLLMQWHQYHVSTMAAAMATRPTTFTISNYCPHPIWPGTLAGAGTSQLSTTGFRLDPGQTAQLAAPAGWSGRIWARTGCAFDAAGAGVCQTGDCGGRLQCQGSGATPPATLFEVTLAQGKGQDQDFYDVSLVDGYNLPVVAIPRARQGSCNATGCMADLNRSCPRELQVDCGGGAIACRSACEAFGQDRYCCSGAYGTPGACRPTVYSAIFKSACPRAYSYAYDDSTSTFTCRTALDYTIAFCLPTSGIKKSDAVFLGAQVDDAGQQSTGGDRSAPPTVYSNGGYRPPIYNYGGGGFRVPAVTRTSSASKRHIQPWLLLLLVLVFFT